MHNLTVRVDGLGSGGCVARQAKVLSVPSKAHCPRFDHLENSLSESRTIYSRIICPAVILDALLGVLQ